MISIKQLLSQWWHWAEERQRVQRDRATRGFEKLLGRTQENQTRFEEAEKLDRALIQLSEHLIHRLSATSSADHLHDPLASGEEQRTL